MVKSFQEWCCPGLADGSPGVGEDEEAMIAKNRQIDRQILEWRNERRNMVQLLLLGPGESGKSTILKQMKILHRQGYNEQERQQYINIIHRNVVDCMCAILTAMENMGMPYEDPARASDAESISYLKPCSAFDTHLTNESGLAVKRLWTDRGVQQAYDMRADYQIYDCAQYFFDNIDRISAPGYLPTYDDILCTRLETTQVVQTMFDYKNISFKMYDVGGQRTQRSKWIHCFDDVTAIIFVIALSEYNLKLAEDNETNRMVESMKLFSTICNLTYFKDTSLILFLNKTDIFEKKILHVPITVAFPEYTGPNYPRDCMEYIQDRIIELNQSETKAIFPHFTNATDTNNIKFVFGAVAEIFLENNLKSAGLV